MTKHRLATALAALGMAAALTACGGGGSGKKLDVAGLVRLGDDVAAKKTTTCPVPYRMDKAAKSAGLPGPAGPAHGADAVTADTTKHADPSSPLVTYKGVVVYCNYLLGAEPVEVDTVGTATKDAAVAIMLPKVARDAQLATSGVTAYAKKVAAAAPRAATLTPSGNVAVVKLPTTSGSVAVIVTVGAQAHTAFSATAVRKAAQTLGAQAAW